MRSAALRALAAGAAILLAYPALAQFQPGGGGRGGFGRGPGNDPAMLLLNKSVQDELKLTDAQKADLGKVQEKMTAAFGKARESGDFAKGKEIMQSVGEEVKKDLDKWKEASLKPDQSKRLQQIHLQRAGVEGLTETDVQKELKLSDKQKSEIKDLADSAGKDVQELRSAARGDREKMREVGKKAEAVRNEAMDKAAALLTDDQKKAWKELVGEKFEFKPDAPPGGGGGRRRQGGGNNNKSGE
jgi:Spy/CpxP family protein refolding chaperone